MEDELKALREEIAALRKEVATLRAERVVIIQQPVMPAAPGWPPPPWPPQPQRVNPLGPAPYSPPTWYSALRGAEAGTYAQNSDGSWSRVHD